MSNSSVNGRQFCADLSKNFGERVAVFIRARFPTKPAESAAAETGIPVARIEKWLDGTCAPKGADSFVMLRAWGPEFLCAALGEWAPGWADEASREERRRKLRAEIEALEAKLRRVEG